MIHYGQHQLDESDIAKVTEVLSRPYITQGPVVEEFERAVSDYCLSGFACAVNSGTSALYLACRLLSIQPGDWVWTTPISYVASANCAALCGAQVRFIDIDMDTYNLDLDHLSEALTLAEQQGTLPKAIIAVHFAGVAMDMKRLKTLVSPYGIRVIEDACHAFGSRYPSGEPVGCGKYSDLTVFSFHAVKAITSAEGGMLLTRHENLKVRADALRNGGVSRDESAFQEESHGPWYYEQQELGMNFRMPDILAAMGLSQLEKIEQFYDKRKALMSTYLQSGEQFGLSFISDKYLDGTNFHLCVALMAEDSTLADKREVFERMARVGIKLNVHYRPIYQQPYYRQQQAENKIYLKNAEEYYRRTITLPLYVGLCHVQVKSILSQLKAIVLEKAREKVVCYG